MSIPHNFEHCRKFKEGICLWDGKICNLMNENKKWCIDYRKYQKLKR